MNKKELNYIKEKTDDKNYENLLTNKIDTHTNLIYKIEKPMSDKLYYN